MSRNCLALCAGLVKRNDSNKGRLDLCKYYSIYGNMWKLILQSRTLSLCSKSSMKYLEEEPTLQCRRQYARRTHRHEAWFRGYRGSPGLGGIRTARLYPLVGLLDYEDTILKTSSRVRMGLSLAWKASLAIRICRSPTIVTDSV